MVDFTCTPSQQFTFELVTLWKRFTSEILFFLIEV